MAGKVWWRLGALAALAAVVVASGCELQDPDEWHGIVRSVSLHDGVVDLVVGSAQITPPRGNTHQLVGGTGLDFVRTRGGTLKVFSVGVGTDGPIRQSYIGDVDGDGLDDLELRFPQTLQMTQRLSLGFQGSRWCVELSVVAAFEGDPGVFHDVDMGFCTSDSTVYLGQPAR